MRSAGKNASSIDVASTGLQRIYPPPYIGVTGDEKGSGAGTWAKFGPVFEGVEWHKDRCRVLGLLCDTQAMVEFDLFELSPFDIAERFET